MAYVKVSPPSEVYHLTKKENLDSILDSGSIRRFRDTECWFCESPDKMRAYMEQTVLCEGKPYYAVGGQLCCYPKFIPEDYVLLRLVPLRREDNWYRWEQEVPPNSPKELVQAAKEFSQLKVGYRGDLAFKGAECIDVPRFLLDGTVIRQAVWTSGELREELRQRIEESQAAYTAALYQMGPSQLIARAAEIEANRFCYNTLMTTELSRDILERLNAVDDPLETIRDAWVSAQEVGQEEEFDHVLFEVCERWEQEQEMQM